MFYADEIGLDTVVTDLKKYVNKRLSPDFEPARLLQQLADSGSTFAAWHASRTN